MNEEQFILLAIKVLSGNHLPEEPEELRRQMTAHEPYRAVFEKLSVYWKADPLLAINETAALEKVWGRIGQGPGYEEVAGDIREIDTPVRKIGWKRILAAAVLLPLISWSIWLFMHSSRKTELVEKYNQKGIRSIIILPDGSKIWLNADSRLKYPAAFQDSLREVYLEGEAFFEIAKNPQRPFVVHLPKGNVHVLGTSFDIRAYADEELMTTSLATGRVSFVPGSTVGSAAKNFYLAPNQKAVYRPQSDAVSIEPTDAEADRAWINGIMTFNNESLGRIAVELERSFGKPIKFRNSSLAQYRYTATFKNNTEEEILSTLKRVKAFHFTVTDKYIEINK